MHDYHVLFDAIVNAGVAHVLQSDWLAHGTEIQHLKLIDVRQD